MATPTMPRKGVARFLAGLSPEHWSAALVIASFLMGLLVLALAYIYGGALFGVHGQDSVEALIAHVAAGPLAPLWVMLVFSGLAIAGVPQFILIAATIVVFGPWLGGLYSWLATAASAGLGFLLGRLFAARMMARYGGERLNRLSALIARHGILSTALIRNVPAAPFIVVNVAAGATQMSTAKFMLGTGLGIIPKIVFIMLVGTGVMDAFTHWRTRDVIWIAAGLLGWVGAGYLAKRYWDRLHHRGRQG
jgi:uncharacterized membrane protein YdjX (TVP38/TMEM64 family)